MAKNLPFSRLQAHREEHLKSAAFWKGLMAGFASGILVGCMLAAALIDDMDRFTIPGTNKTFERTNNEDLEVRHNAHQQRNQGSDSVTHRPH
jgi:hypothetical protein